jgi:hypothetical protein
MERVKGGAQTRAVIFPLYREKRWWPEFAASICILVSGSTSILPIKHPFESWFMTGRQSQAALRLTVGQLRRQASY